MKPACVKCGRFFRIKTNGVVMIEGMPKFNGAEPGKAHSADWVPYKIWRADLWECKSCGAEILGGYSLCPIEKFEKRFEEEKELATITIYDC